MMPNHNMHLLLFCYKKSSFSCNNVLLAHCHIIFLVLLLYICWEKVWQKFQSNRFYTFVLFVLLNGGVVKLESTISSMAKVILVFHIVIVLLLHLIILLICPEIFCRHECYSFKNVELQNEWNVLYWTLKFSLKNKPTLARSGLLEADPPFNDEWIRWHVLMKNVFSGYWQGCWRFVSTLGMLTWGATDSGNDTGLAESMWPDSTE